VTCSSIISVPLGHGRQLFARVSPSRQSADTAITLCGDVIRRATTLAADLIHDDTIDRVCEHESNIPRPDFRSPQTSLEVERLAGGVVRLARLIVTTIAAAA
jgi:hypothetical protein